MESSPTNGSITITAAEKQRPAKACWSFLLSFSSARSTYVIRREAKVWNCVLEKAEKMAGIEKGSIRDIVLIQTLPVALQMDEILYDLRDHSVGLNCGKSETLFVPCIAIRDMLKSTSDMHGEQGILQAWSVRTPKILRWRYDELPGLIVIDFSELHLRLLRCEYFEIPTRENRPNGYAGFM
ncbi:hypothetical protein C5167_004271 [Papaver somniferum]|nr:hypothetical protein C5167_004271 [Papaver somniferum]